MDGRFTDEELAIAKSVDLCAVAESLGYTVKRIGKYHTLKEMDSIRIYNRSHWYRWSRQFDKGNNGGSQIDFLRVFCGMSVKEAVFWLLDFAGYRRIENPVKQPLVHQVSQKQAEERKPFVLPEPAGDNSYLISYLNQEREISRTVIDLFLKDGLIYESRHYHNVVFKGNDKNGVTRFASMRGVFDKQGKPFKCDVTGNDKNYGFNVVNVNSTELVVFEAAIDLMSYVDIFTDYESNKLALGMLADAPLETFLREHPQITSIRFCLGMLFEPVALLLLHAMNFHVGESYKYYFVMVICSFVRGNVMYILSKLISKKGMQIANFPKEILGVLVMVFTFTVLNCCFVILLSLEAGSEKSLLMCASIVISIVLTDYFMLYMMERFNYLVQKQYEDAMYREEMHYKDIYYEEAEKQNKEVQKLKHDMKHKLHELYHLVENSDGQELSEKIGAMCMEFEQIDEKQYSDNPIVDSVLRIKFGRAKARGIKVETSIRIPKQMQLDHGDMSNVQRRWWSRLMNCIRKSNSLQ